MMNRQQISKWWIKIIGNATILENSVDVVLSQWAISMFHHMLAPPHQTLAFDGGDRRVLMLPGECWDGTLLVV